MVAIVAVPVSKASSPNISAFSAAGVVVVRAADKTSAPPAEELVVWG